MPTFPNPLPMNLSDGENPQKKKNRALVSGVELVLHRRYDLIPRRATMNDEAEERESERRVDL